MAEMIGFIGLGNIGGPMARNVLGAGFGLVALDLQPEALARLTEAGAQPADSPRAVAGAARTICLSLPTSNEVEQVCFGPDGIVEGAEPGTIVVDLTSGNPSQTAAIGARLRASGIELVDAGVSGGVPGAEAGMLGIMCGGSIEAYEACLPVLEAIGTQIFHLGEPGAGHLTKALNNFCSAANYLALSEAMTVATKAGLDPLKVLGAINASSGRSWTSENRFPKFVLAGDFSSRGGMATELMVKDLANAVAGGKEQGVPMPIAGLVSQLFLLSQALHGPKAPNQIAVRMYEQWGQAESRAPSP